jgi:hypothetical protein
MPDKKLQFGSGKLPFTFQEPRKSRYVNGDDT